MKLQISLFAALLCAAIPTFAAPTTISGRVLDENGAGASGAWVTALEADAIAPVRADENGAFELRDVPLDSFTLLAARGLSVARLPAAASAATPIELRLQLPAAPDREALAARALEGKISWWRIEDNWDVLGQERVLKLIDRQLASNENMGGFESQTIIDTLEKRAPQELVPRAPALFGALPEKWKSQRQARITLIRVKSGDAEARRAADAWLDEQKLLKRNIDAQSVTQLLHMASIAVELKRPDADTWLDYAATLARQTPGLDAGDSASWGVLVAPMGYENAERFAEVLKPVNEFYFWSYAYRELAENGDIDDAEKAIARMDVLAKMPEMAPRDDQRVSETPDSAVEGARLLLAKLVAKRDPARALELAPTSGVSRDLAAIYLAIADGAIQAGKPNVAARALNSLRPLLMLSPMNPANLRDSALAASLAQSVSPQLGAEFWDMALKLTAPQSNALGLNIVPPSIGMWAFYHARLDAAQSRVLIEREWSWRLPAAMRPTNRGYSDNKGALAILQIGMAAVDPARALEMRDEMRAALGDRPPSSLGGAPNGEAADLNLAAAILASEPQRARMGADAQFVRTYVVN